MGLGLVVGSGKDGRMEWIGEEREGRDLGLGFGLGLLWCRRGGFIHLFCYVFS